MHPHQFGFRSNYSTRDAIAHVISSLMSKINSNQHTALALLDLKKAFDPTNPEHKFEPILILEPFVTIEFKKSDAYIKSEIEQL